MAKNEHIEIADFINTVKDGIMNSQDRDKFELNSNVDFELAVSVKKAKKGKAEVFVAGIGGEYEKHTLSKIKFSMGNKRSSDLAIKPILDMLSAFGNLSTQEFEPPKKQKRLK